MEQTDSHTPVTTMDTATDQSKHAGQAKFLLIAQDITAPLVIDFWVRVQQRMRDLLATGLTLSEAEQAVRCYYFLDNRPTVGAMEPDKLADASAIADVMAQFPGRRLAD